MARVGGEFNTSDIRQINEHGVLVPVVGSRNIASMVRGESYTTGFSQAEDSVGGPGNDRRKDVGMEGIFGLCNCLPSDGVDQTTVLARRLYRFHRHSRHRYLSDVIVPPTDAHVEEIVEELIYLLGVTSGTSTSGVRLVSVHEQHIHVVHTCAYSNGSCRLSVAQKFRRMAAIPTTSTSTTKFRR